MTNFQKQLKLWKERQVYANSILEESKPKVCPWENRVNCYGLDHAKFSSFNGPTIFSYPYFGYVCACGIKILTNRIFQELTNYLI